MRLQVGEAGYGLLVPSERMSSLEATATYWKSMKELQEEAKNFYNSVQSKIEKDIPLTEEEQKSLCSRETN